MTLNKFRVPTGLDNPEMSDFYKPVLSSPDFVTECKNLPIFEKKKAI